MVVGIAGSFAAGKGEVVRYLVEHKGFTHYSASACITEEIVKRGLTINRDSMIQVANELRAEYGPAYIVSTLYTRARAAGGNAVIESLRAVAEVRAIKVLGGVVIGVDADPKLRYQRATERKSVKDNVTYEKWLAQEREESNPHDPTKQDIFGALQLADHLILNNGSLEELHQEIERVYHVIEQSLSSK